MGEANIQANEANCGENVSRNVGIRKEQNTMKKWCIGSREPLEGNWSKNSFMPNLLHTIIEKIITFLGLTMLLSIPLFIIGEAFGADRSFELFLCLPFSLSSIAFLLLFSFSDLAKDAAKQAGYEKVPKVTFAACFVTAAIDFLFLLMPTALDLTASFHPPVIELTHLSAEYREGSDAVSDNAGSTPDEWNLSGIDSLGTEYELSIHEDDWNRLEEIGTSYAESWDVYRMEFNENVCLVGHWLPGSGKLIDWKIE